MERSPHITSALHALEDAVYGCLPRRLWPAFGVFLRQLAFSLNGTVKAVARNPRLLEDDDDDG